MAFYPDLQLCAWLFDFMPFGFWKTTPHSQFFDWLFDRLEYKSMDSWYNITTEEIVRNGGGALMYLFGGSPSSALQSVYPQHKWDLHKFKIKRKEGQRDYTSRREQFLETKNLTYVPKGFWLNQTHQRQFFDWLFHKLGYKSMDDWYSVMAKDIIRNGGSYLLICKYSTSPSAALQSVYPEHKWDLHKFKHKPKELQIRYSSERKSFLETKNMSDTQKGFWQNETHQKEFMDWLFDRLKYQSMEDWYTVTVDDIYSNGGGTLLRTYHNDSPSAALQSVYPQHKWDLHKFKNKPKELRTRQKTEANEKLFFDGLLGQLEHEHG